MPNIALFYGTRPEAIKLGPVAAALREEGVEPIVVCTGQHTDLLQGTPADSDLADGTSLAVASDDNVPRYVHTATKAITQWLRKTMPDTVVVQGDTMSALAAAKAARTLDIKLVHVEAGVRSHMTDPWPEEHIRVEIDSLADVHLAATTHARDNLYAEGYKAASVRVTGNTVVSAIARYTQARPSPEAGATLLVTLHRRELRQRGGAARAIAALYKMANDLPHVGFLWPVHPAMRGFVTARPPTNLALVGPLSYRQAVEGLATCRGVLTDSGGLVEEAATLGVPCAIARHVNDRPEAVLAGVAERFDPTYDGIADAVMRLVRREIPRRATNVFGNVTAAKNVAKELV